MMRFTRWIMLLLALALPLATHAQSTDTETTEAQDISEPQNRDFTAFNAEISTRQSAFGVAEPYLSGRLRNNTDNAFRNVNVYADIYGADDEIIGEGFGFIVDACGAALIEDPIQPDQLLRFELDVELFEPDAEIARWQIYGEGTAIEPESNDLDADTVGVQRASDGEVVLVEWEDEQTLLYGVGCRRDVFTAYDWYRYDLESGRAVRLSFHPEAVNVTDAMILQTGMAQVTQTRETDMTLFNASFLTFPTQSERIIYQTDVNTLFTANEDGSFKRQVHTLLHTYNLQGFVWSPLGNFLAYYYGAYGEPVNYITASTGGRLISRVIGDNTPSVTVPGISDDGTLAVIGGTFSNADGDEITGYYWKSTQTGENELLFEVGADGLPGNNYPAPAYWRRDSQTRYFYVVRPDTDPASDTFGHDILQCYYREGEELHTLTPLPLDLDTDERARTWLSPDANTLALAANGLHGGLWLIDLNAFDVCR
jgi:hypothetical protein